MRLISILLILSPLFASAQAPETKHDAALWNALVDLDARASQQFHQSVKVNGGITLGVFAVISAIADGEIGRTSNLTKALAAAPAVLTVLGIVALVREHFPAGPEADARRRDADNFAIERQSLRKIRKLLKRPLYSQYDRASRDPALRNFVVALDEWLRAGAVDHAPPAIGPSY